MYGCWKHQAMMDTGIKGGTNSFKILRTRGMENDVMLGEMSGKRRRGRHKNKMESAAAVVAMGRTRLDVTR